MDVTMSNVEPCEFCKQLDFLKVERLFQIFRGPYQDLSSIVIARAGERYKQPPSNDCLLCHAFYRLRVHSHSSSSACSSACSTEDSPHEIRAICFDDPFDVLQRNQEPPGKWDMRVVIALTVVSSSIHENNEKWFGKILKRLVTQEGGLFCFKPAGPGRISSSIAQAFEPEFALQCLGECSRFHPTCGVISGQTTGAINLKLIDCEDGIVIKSDSSKQQYIALSYVWGKRIIQSESTKFFSNKDSLPTVVLDAMAVTRSLGFRYLWVDQYCIDQNDTKDKHDQIRQMDIIYHHAFLTIVAAAGDNANYGLPGVGKRSRKISQGIMTFGNMQVAIDPRHPMEDIDYSRWACRGWTYQEAYYSRRLLIFTDEQVYFECGSGSRYEGSGMLQGLMSGVKLYESRATRSLINGPRLSFSTESQLVMEEFGERVRQYSLKSLTFGEDALNAYAGIMRRFEERPVGSWIPYVTVPWPLAERGHQDKV